MSKTTDNQVIRKVRGTANFFNDTDFEFVASKESGPRYEEVKKTRTSSLNLTAGTGRKSYVAHLKVPSDSFDPTAELYRELERLTVDFNKTETPPKPTGETLYRSDALTICKNEKKGCVSIGINIDLSQHIDFLQFTYQQINEITKCLHFNEDSLRQLCRVIAKRSQKQ